MYVIYFITVATRVLVVTASLVAISTLPTYDNVPFFLNYILLFYLVR